jgi:5-methylthioribose kinase
MYLIDATNAEAYLRDTGRIADGERVAIRELSGGVSNIVLLVEFADAAREPFVLKQAREQLRVKEPWFCSPERIWREVEFLRVCQPWMDEADVPSPRITLPSVILVDRSNYLFAMTAAPARAVTWKQMLLAGRIDINVTRAGARLMATLHMRSWKDEQVARAFESRRFFSDLRVDPYYRQIAAVHPLISLRIDQLIASLENNCVALVHGDFSPKNLLVSDGELMLIDCEVAHYGDPAFDIGFFLSHLALKAIHLRTSDTVSNTLAVANTLVAFEIEYKQHIAPLLTAMDYAALERRGCRNLAACLLARIDGKSPVGYLTIADQDLVRQLAIQMFRTDVDTLGSAFSLILYVVSTGKLPAR